MPALPGCERDPAGGLPVPPWPTLHLFRDALATRPARAYRRLARACAAGSARAAAAAYAELFAALAAEGWRGEAWRAHVAAAAAADANPFTLAARPAEGLAEAARLDLDALERWADPAGLEGVRTALGAAGYRVAACRDLGERAPSGVAAALASGTGWSLRCEEVRAHALAGGAGRYAAHLAYRWCAPARALEPIEPPDLPDERELFGYERQRAQVRENTERFLQGLPAHDVLLYGERGTGKSTAVKALLPRFGARGLRLIELGRRNLPDLPRLWDLVDGAPQRFIVYVDDLSFDASETAYKDAKAALQGGLRARPRNALVYATSNRRHLVAERWADRDGAAPAGEGADGPRPGDAVEERLSLADRFGLTVVFGAPDQELYLGIVRHLAALRALPVAEGDLRERALAWALWHNGRSGRTARQFIATLEGEQARMPAGARGQ